MEGLDAALERARQAYADEREMMRLRQDVARERNRLRKVSPASMAKGRAVEMLEELDWWGIRRPDNVAEATVAEYLLRARLEQREVGTPGDADLRVAGFELMRFWTERGNAVTATKLDKTAGAGGEAGAGDEDGRTFAPSPAVAWLAEQLPQIVPWLGKGDPKRPGWTPALDKAYTIARAWLDEEPPHWTEFAPRSPPEPGGIS